jgi:acyl carrier protein
MAETQERATLDTIRPLLVNHLGRAAEEVTPEAKLMGDLHCDSLDVVELVMAIEEAFGVEIEDREMPVTQEATVATLVAMVDRHLEARHG